MELKRQGDALLDGKRFDEALAAYNEAYKLTPTAALQYNRGRALQFLARYPEALGAIRVFARDATPQLRSRVPGLSELLADLESRVASITIRCDIVGARVMLGGLALGSCPFAAPIEVNAGKQVIEAFAEGYFTFRRELALPGRASSTVDVVLAARNTSGLLVVKSRVLGSRVSADGRPIGLVPAESALSAGTHTVLVEHDGYDAATTRVVLVTGERKELVLDPLAKPSIFTRWWFWTIAGAVVVGGVVTYAALTTEKSPPDGDFSPGTIRF